MHRFAARPRATLLLLVISIAACSDRGGSAGGATGGTMVIAVGGSDVGALLPPFTGDATSRNISDQLFLHLADIGDDLNTFGDAGFIPRLARSWTWAKDSLSIAFSMDPRARWHDGQPVRAQDVAYTFAVVKDPKSATPFTGPIANIDSITVRDSLTAVAWFHKRTPEQFYDVVYQLAILPEHLLRDIPHDKLMTSQYNRAPVGNGRFRFSKLEPGVRLELLADTGNFLGRAQLDRVVWSLAADAGNAITQLMAGQADVYENLPADVLPTLDSSKAVRALRYPGMQYAFMGFNTRNPKRLSDPHPLFADARVRRALSMALDRQSMLRNVFDTVGILGSGPYPRPLSDSTIALPPFDRARAAALLDSAGWIAGADGIRAKNGKPLAFSLMVPTSSRPRMRYAVLMQEQLKAIGATMTLESLEFNAFFARQDAKNFDAALMSVGVDPSRASVAQSWTKSGTAKGGQNYTQYVNPRVDAAMDTALTTFDPRLARESYHRAVQMLVDDAPAVWLYDVLTIAGVHKRLRPAPTRADAWWWHLADWSVPANARIDRDRIGLRPSSP